MTEQERLTNELVRAGVSEERIELLKTIIENTAWMKQKLDETRETIKNTAVAIPYDNGGGQKGIRENPLFKGYESLFKSYMAGMSKLLDLLPPQTAKEIEAEVEAPKTVLQLVRKKHGKEA